MRNNPLFLIGYRGTGKSTIGRLVADWLGWGFVDADELLEQHAGKSIRQIFADDGETAFRDHESAVLRDLANREQAVIATGGGVVLRPENRANLNERGTVVWLTAPAEVIWQRLQHDTTTAERRPDLTQGGRAEIDELLAVRTPLYASCADLTVDTSTHSPDEIARLISDWIASRER